MPPFKNLVEWKSQPQRTPTYQIRRARIKAILKILALAQRNFRAQVRVVSISKKIQPQQRADSHRPREPNQFPTVRTPPLCPLVPLTYAPELPSAFIFLNTIYSSQASNFTL